MGVPPDSATTSPAGVAPGSMSKVTHPRTHWPIGSVPLDRAGVFSPRRSSDYNPLFFELQMADNTRANPACRS